jgi:hypothetical protein
MPARLVGNWRGVHPEQPGEREARAQAQQAPTPDPQTMHEALAQDSVEHAPGDANVTPRGLLIAWIFVLVVLAGIVIALAAYGRHALAAVVAVLGVFFVTVPNPLFWATIARARERRTVAEKVVMHESGPRDENRPPDPGAQGDATRVDPNNPPR